MVWFAIYYGLYEPICGMRVTYIKCTDSIDRWEYWWSTHDYDEGPFQECYMSHILKCGYITMHADLRRRLKTKHYKEAFREMLIGLIMHMRVMKAIDMARQVISEYKVNEIQAFMDWHIAGEISNMYNMYTGKGGVLVNYDNILYMIPYDVQYIRYTLSLKLRFLDGPTAARILEKMYKYGKRVLKLVTRHVIDRCTLPVSVILREINLKTTEYDLAYRILANYKK